MKGQRLLIPALLVAALVSGAVEARAQAPQEDLKAIEQTALDYIEGWYTGDAARMERALHPELAKRIVAVKDGQSQLNKMGQEQLVAAVASGRGKNTPPAEQRKDVKILDVFGNTATVRLDARDWVDYMHLARWNGRWVIVNVLWELRPQS
jgi:hypothetical protein